MDALIRNGEGEKAINVLPISPHRPEGHCNCIAVTSEPNEDVCGIGISECVLGLQLHTPLVPLQAFQIGSRLLQHTGEKEHRLRILCIKVEGLAKLGDLQS